MMFVSTGVLARKSLVTYTAVGLIERNWRQELLALLLTAEERE